MNGTVIAKKAQARQRAEILFGGLVMVLAAGLVAVAFAGSRVGSDSGGYVILAHFGQVDGITLGSEVTLAGVPVGAVSGLSYDAATRQAVVTMTLDQDYRLPVDSAALVVQVGLLGQKFIKIEPGAEDEMLESGGDIEFVQDSVHVLDLLQKLIADVEARQARRKSAKKAAK